MFVRALPLALAALVAVGPVTASAQLRAQLIATGFDRPNSIVVDPFVPGAIYVVDQIGLVRTFINGAPRATPFLDLRSVVSGGYDERGLLGMAFPPDGATSGRVFIHFTTGSGGGRSVVRRYTRSAADPMVVDPASAFDLQWPAAGGGRQGFITQDFQNHNGGHLAFGPDGFLYLGMGDGGSGNDPNNRAQSPTTLLGKMLRVDVAGNPPNGYTIPAGNPTFPVANALPEIWAFGLRNPWRYSFDDFGTGATNALIIADVGQFDREEIDYEPAGQGGRNYGWRVFEGPIDNPNITPEAPAFLPVQPPVFNYDHTVGQAITGGYVYRGGALGAAYRGRYFYADCVQGRIWSLQFALDPGTGEATGATSVEHTSEMGGGFNCIAGFFRDPAGELYFMDFNYATGGPGTGRVFRIVPATPQVPAAPVNVTSSVVGSTVMISWDAGAGGGTATSYEVVAGNAPGTSNVGTFSVADTSLGASGVPTGGYFVRVRGRNAVGVSALSAEIAIAVGCSFPAAPTGFTSAVSGNTVTLGWNVATGITGTVLEAGYAPGFATPALTFPFAAPAAGASFSGVPSGTYYVRTRAVNACGQGALSTERTVVVP
jgi:glucose/arabinose dehydrogenase